MDPTNEPETKPETNINPEPSTESATPEPAPTESAPTSLTPDAPSQPVEAAPVSADPLPTTATAPAKATTGGTGAKPKRKKLLFIVAAIVLIALLGGGYVFGMYIPNQPENVYKSGLSNTAKGYDKLTGHLADEQQKHYKGSRTNGSFKFAAGSMVGEGSFSGQNNGGNSTAKLDLDVAGQKFAANLRTIQPSGQTTPDVYLQLTGIKSAVQSYGLNGLEKLDGQWVGIDHTLIDGLVHARASDSSVKLTTPTQAQIQDALAKIGTVNRQYIFSTDSQAVLQNKKYLGKSTQDGRSVYGYQVGYDKTNLKAYVKALGQALDSSSLNTWVKQVSHKSISDSMNISQTNSAIDKTKADYTFTMYIDAKTKLIHQLHFADTTDPTNNYLNLGLNYTGGDEFPFVLELHAKSGTNDGDGKITLTLNTKTNKLSFGFKLNATSGKTPITASANFDVTPSNEDLKVTVPAGARPAMEVLQSLNLGGLLGSKSTGQSTIKTQTATDPSNLFLLSQ